MKLTKGAKVRILATGEIGTVAEKKLYPLGGEANVYVRVVTKSAPGGIWLLRERLADVVEHATVTLAHEGGAKLLAKVGYNHETENMTVEVTAADGTPLPDLPPLLQSLAGAMLEGLGAPKSVEAGS